MGMDPQSSAGHRSHTHWDSPGAVMETELCHLITNANEMSQPQPHLHLYTLKWVRNSYDHLVIFQFFRASLPSTATASS